MAAVAMEQPASLGDRLQGMRRHRGAMLLTVLIGAALTAALALLLPPTYRSTATILIEQQEIPQDLVRSTVTSFADQRVQVISQRVMTSQNLMGIIERYDLYAAQRQRKSREAIIEGMRNDIKLKMISANVVDPRSGRPTQATIAFTVSYDNGRADTATKVANELTSLYLNENLTMRSAAAKESATFLTSEADTLRDDITKLAAKIAAFKEQHATEMPDLGQVNFQLVDRTELELRDIDNRIAAMDGQRLVLEAQLAQLSPTSQVYGEAGERIMSPADRLRQLRASLASLKARYGPDHPDVLKTEREVAGLQALVGDDDAANDLLRRLDETRGQLAAARDRYSPDHPDVQRLTREVDSLEAQLKDVPAAERVRKARSGADNPAYLQVRTSLETLAIDRAAQVHKAAELHGRLDDYERRLSKAPEVEKQYRALSRDYDNAQLKYQEVRMKQREADAGQNLETEHKGERFTLIEPPQRPEDPISPNRPVLFVLGLFVSAALAFGVYLVRDGLDASVRSLRDLTRLVEVPPLAAIPFIETHAEVRQRARIMMFALAGSAVAVAAGLLTVHLFVRPLDLVWFALARRLGL
jgi:uncharacterized protein involved in exopolysaccharide biosynthesis